MSGHSSLGHTPLRLSFHGQSSPDTACNRIPKEYGIRIANDLRYITLELFLLATRHAVQNYRNQKQLGRK